tara:strand:+ start:265 stop:591 length:327 start_codon:yes stop_codon:yes gene_type:complete
MLNIIQSELVAANSIGALVEKLIPPHKRGRGTMYSSAVNNEGIIYVDPECGRLCDARELFQDETVERCSRFQIVGEDITLGETFVVDIPSVLREELRIDLSDCGTQVL